METFSACLTAFLAASCVATIVTTMPSRLALTVAVILAIAVIVVWSEWVKQVRPVDDMQQYGPLFSLVLGAIIGGFWG